MRPLPYVDPVATVLFAIAAAAVVLVQLSITFLGGRPSRRRDDVRYADRGSLALVGVTLYVGLGGGILVARVVPAATVAGGEPSLRWAVFAVGIVLMVAGAGLRQWAIVTLGRFFTINVQVTADQRVVDTGPYRWLRHPSYTGLLMSFGGLGLALGNWLTVLLATVVPLLGLVYRIRVEEMALRDNLGEGYELFASGRSRLVPGVW